MRVRWLSLSLGVAMIVSVWSVQPSMAVSGHLRDGPAACSAGYPPSPYGGMCATYGGVNTWFGSYGPGFPSSTGWGFCADSPNSANFYPDPSYRYQASAPPSGTNTSIMNPLGYAFSQFTALGYWSGVKGSFTKDEAFVAGDLLYDAQAWGTPLPSMPLGVERAYQSLANFYNAAVGSTANPTISLSQQGGGTSFVDAATLVATVTFPGTHRGIAGLVVTLQLTNAIADANGASSITQTTAKNGTITVPITAIGPGPLRVGATASVAIGKRGMGFFGPTTQILNAQVIAAPNAPATIQTSSEFTSQGPAMVSQSFSKTANGNMDPAQISLAGAVIEVSTASGFLAAECTTTSLGTCTTPSTLIDATTYLWKEVTAPPGLASGASGSFIASATSSATPIGLVDPGEMIQVEALKVDHASPSTIVPGATFDLYRMDHAAGPNQPEAPADAPSLKGGTWVARAESTSSPALFGWQYPGYAYCVQEFSAPVGYSLNPNPSCSDVVMGTTTTPPTVLTLRVADAETTTQLFVAKYNTSEPDQGIAGASYDLYVKDPGPLSTPSIAPEDAVGEPGLTWYARGSTNASGHLGFTIPVGYAWCVLEHQAPVDFQLDPGLHCTAIIHHGAPDPVRTVSVSEIPRTVTLNAYKFNASVPDSGVPNATYALFVKGAFPDGYTPVPAPVAVSTPPGMMFYATATTSTTGHLRFTVPAGHAWCLQELTVPQDYILDTGLHCSAVLNNADQSAVVLALPELANTGAPLRFTIVLALILIAGGFLIVGRYRRRH